MGDISKIEQVKHLLGTSSFSQAEWIDQVTALARSIADQEDQDLMLEKIVIASAAAGQWDKAREVAGHIENSFEKAEALYEVASRLSRTGQLEKALRMLKESEITADCIEEPWQRAEILNRIARSLAGIDEINQARQVWEQAVSVARSGENRPDTQQSVDSSSVLREIVESLAEVGDTERALEIAKQIKNTGKREGALNTIMKQRQQ